jgi:hypothetical protein
MSASSSPTIVPIERYRLPAVTGQVVARETAKDAQKGKIPGEFIAITRMSGIAATLFCVKEITSWILTDDPFRPPSLQVPPLR